MVVVVVGAGMVVVDGAGMVVVVVVVVGTGTAVVVVVAGEVVVVTLVVVVTVVVTLVVVVTGVVGARVVAAAEVGLEDEAGDGGPGTMVVVTGIVEVLEEGGSATFGVSSDPVRHAPRSNGTNTREAVHCFPIRPERRACREQSHRDLSGGFSR